MLRDEIYMRRCIQLALNGRNNVSPNPMVGAVIVYGEKIIGEGYHARCGEAHAEVMAINSVADPALLKHSTVYISLEPCSHYGKTPPCADLIISMGIPKVVVGCRDPSIKVSGRGIKKIQDAGIEVKIGVLESECRELIRNFIVFNTLQRPYIVLKWAESADGFLDLNRSGGSPEILSTELTTMLVHKRRTEADAVMIGTQTALLDNPSLTVRNWYGRNPVRVILDKHLSLPRELHVFNDEVHTLAYTIREHEDTGKTEYIKLNPDNWMLPQIMYDLYKRNIQNLLVEGGSKLLQSFLNDGLWDEIFIERSRKMLGSGVKAPEIRDKNRYSVEQHFGELIWHYANVTY